MFEVTDLPIGQTQWSHPNTARLWWAAYGRRSLPVLAYSTWSPVCNNVQLTAIMKCLVVFMLIAQVLCEKPAYGPQVGTLPVQQVSTVDLLHPAYFNFGINAGYRLPNVLPSLVWRPTDVPIPAPELRYANIPYPYLSVKPRVNVRTEPVQLPIGNGYY